jgi:hypothetical protein
VRRARRRVAPLAKRDAIRVAAVDDRSLFQPRAGRASTFDIGAIDRETRNARRGD